MKIYLVTDGYYDQVCGVFSTRELAEQCQKFLQAEDIKEWTLDEMPESLGPPNHYRFEVDMNEDGIVSEVDQTNSTYPIHSSWEPYGNFRDVVFTLWARNPSHAVDLANEKRLQLLASGEWTIDHNEWFIRQRASTKPTDQHA